MLKDIKSINRTYNSKLMTFSFQCKLKELFQITNVKDMYKTLIMKRKNKKKPIIIILITMLTLLILVSRKCY